MILEYKMDRDFNGALRTPAWVECGGFFQWPYNRTLVGFSPAVRDYKIPDTARVLTVEDLKSRVRSLGYTDETGTLLTDEQCDAMVEDTLAANDVP